MELEKAIEELKRTIEENNRLLLPHNEQFFNKKEKQEIRMQNIAIETVLQALENSIPKEKVLAKIQELDKIAKKKDIIPETVKEEKLDGSYVYSQRFNADGYIAEVIVNVLKDLLEE